MEFCRQFNGEFVFSFKTEDFEFYLETRGKGDVLGGRASPSRIKRNEERRRDFLARREEFPPLGSWAAAAKVGVRREDERRLEEARKLARDRRMNEQKVEIEWKVERKWAEEKKKVEEKKRVEEKKLEEEKKTLVDSAAQKEVLANKKEEEEVLVKNIKTVMVRNVPLDVMMTKKEWVGIGSKWGDVLGVERSPGGTDWSLNVKTCPDKWCPDSILFQNI